jgi:PhnB protein
MTPSTMTPEKKKIEAIPKGFHTVTAHLVVRDAIAAIDFYKKAFGAQEMGIMKGPGGKGVIHAMIRIGDSFVMLGEEAKQMNVLAPLTLGNSPVTNHLYVEDADRTFKGGSERRRESLDAHQRCFLGRPVWNSHGPGRPSLVDRDP